MNQSTFNYGLKAYQNELKRELKMRQKVWPRLQGFNEKFVNPEHQRQYDILKELHTILVNVPYNHWTPCVQYAESAKLVIESQTELEL